MSDIEKDILNTYGGKLRFRVCGVWVEGNEILLAHHKGLGPKKSLWIPPGGGVEYGENTRDALKREFLEETHIKIQVHEFLFVCEFLSPPLHAIELFFRVTGNREQLITGTDPEMDAHNQLITKVAFMDLHSLKTRSQETLHHVLREIDHPSELIKLKGYFKFD